MELSPEERRRIYEEEKTRVEAQDALKAEKRGLLGRKMGMGCLWIFILFVVLMIVANLADSPSGGSSKLEPMTEEQKLKRGCEVVKYKYADKPIAELSLDNLKQIQICQQLGYY